MAVPVPGVALTNETKGCGAYARRRWDNLAVYHYQFSASQVSTLDYFHPSLSGQAALARVTWAASWWPTS